MAPQFLMTTVDILKRPYAMHKALASAGSGGEVKKHVLGKDSG